ncbi:LysR family transcriptional regulator [Pantoea ananatis]|uniref:LysR family transcriptional regulator n=1 Tax=Pantoea ananas TaxID=553 RepID=UPI0038674F0E
MKDSKWLCGQILLNPAVSKAISRIEQYLCVTLLTRTRTGMSLTEARETTLRHARDITTSFDLLPKEVRNPENEIKGTVRLTAPAIVCEFLPMNGCMTTHRRTRASKSSLTHGCEQTSTSTPPNS